MRKLLTALLLPLLRLLTALPLLLLRLLIALLLPLLRLLRLLLTPLLRLLNKHRTESKDNRRVVRLDGFLCISTSSISYSGLLLSQLRFSSRQSLLGSLA